MNIYASDLHSKEHTSSYYAASQRDKEGFPKLVGAVDADVCIVGGGLSGVATAVELSERGYSVALLEAHRIGWGASGRNGGQVIGGFGESLLGNEASVDTKYGSGSKNAIRNMGAECVDIIRQRVAKYDIECDLTWGYLDAAMKPREMRQLEEWRDNLNKDEFPNELKLVDGEGVKEIVGSDRYVGGLVNKGYGHLQVLDLCKGEARAAEKMGARIFEQSLVTSIDDGPEVKVHTSTGVVKARYLVLCGNAYLKQLAPDLAPSLSPYILPASSYVIATERLSDTLAKDVMAKNYAVCDQRTALDYFRLSADNRLLFGGMANYSARDPKSIAAAMKPKMLKVFPQLKNVAIDFEWGGHMGIGLNRVPQMGRIGQNIYYVQAYSGHGVAPTHMTGRILADLISTQAERFDLFARVHHWPFPGGDYLGQPLLALGMLFYKIRDELY